VAENPTQMATDLLKCHQSDALDQAQSLIFGSALLTGQPEWEGSAGC